MDIPLITPESLVTLGVQAIAVAAVIAVVRQLVPDTVKTIWIATPVTLAVVLLAAFLADMPAQVQTAIVAILQAAVLLAAAYGANAGLGAVENRLHPPHTVQDVAAAAGGQDNRFFRPWA